MTTDHKNIEVHPAYVFDCEECGRENFVRAMVVEFSPAEQEEYALELGEKPQTGDWMTHPDHVTCVHCGATFNALDPGESPE